MAFNQLLDISLRALTPTLNGLDLIAFDTFGALNDIVADPSRYGLANITDRCYTGDDLGFTGGGSVCANPRPIPVLGRYLSDQHRPRHPRSPDVRCRSGTRHAGLAVCRPACR
ncbi:MAG: hypothetical protein ABI478_03140 [Propionivibrio sp.]